MIQHLSGILVIVNVSSKLCDITEYLDFKNSKYRKKLVDKLVEEFSEYIKCWIMEMYVIFVQ